MQPQSSDLMLSDLSKFGDVYNNLTSTTQNLSIFAILCQQNYQQNVTLKNYSDFDLNEIHGRGAQLCAPTNCLYSTQLQTAIWLAENAQNTRKD